MMRSPESARPAGRSRQIVTPTTDSGTTLSIGTFGVAFRYLLLERRRCELLLFFASPMKAVSQSFRVASSDFCATTSEAVIKHSSTKLSISFMASPPLTLHHKSRPVIRRLPLLHSQHLDLRRTQCCRGRLLVLQHAGIKILHQ